MVPGESNEEKGEAQSKPKDKALLHSVHFSQIQFLYVFLFGICKCIINL